MSDKIPFVKEKKYTFEGYYSIPKIYKFFKHYIENNMYYDITEREYVEKNIPPKKTVDVDWVLEKFIDDQYHVLIKMKVTLSGKDAEVEINGRKESMVKGKIILVFNSYVEPQDDAIPNRSVFVKLLKRTYDKFIGNTDLERAGFQAIMDIGEIVAKTKEYFNSITK